MVPFLILTIMIKYRIQKRKWSSDAIERKYKGKWKVFIVFCNVSYKDDVTAERIFHHLSTRRKTRLRKRGAWLVPSVST